MADTASQRSTEREVKLAAWPGFALPQLDDVVPGVVTGEQRERQLDAVYWDTTDLRLVRKGITVRFRSGDGASHWTVKLPQQDDVPPGDAGPRKGVLWREEIDVDGTPESVPAYAARLVRACVRSAPMVPVARITTVRRSLELLDAEAGLVAEVDDDEVSVLDDGRVAARIREVEVELAPETSIDLLPAIVGRLVEAGAGATDQQPKLVRALGPRALAPPMLRPVDVGSSDDAATVVRAALVAAVERVLEHHAVMVVGEDPEGVHQARVGLRRIRTYLQVFRSLFERQVTEPLRAELGWLAAELGAVRDLDVLAMRLRDDMLELGEPDDTKGAEALLGRLDAGRSRAMAELVETFDDHRYVVMLDNLVALALDPPFRGAAAKPAADVLPRFVRDAWRALVTYVERAGKQPTDSSLHRIRVLAKRARYAADVAVPAVGSPARTAARALASAQELLGDHHDSVVARNWLRENAPAAAGVEAFADGLLVGVEEQRADECRAAWKATWNDVSAKKVWTWLT
jgi:CHAD domain-containing protein